MMEEVSLRNHSLKLSLTISVIEYEFPDSSDQLDANWLLVETILVAGEKRFENIDPSLDTRELADIAAWFDALACQRLPSWARLSFTEPNLEFEFFRSTDEFVRIGVHLTNESRPPFEVSSLDEEDALCVFELSYAELTQAAASFRRIAEQFPKKTLSSSLDIESQHFLDRLSSRFSEY